MRGEGERRGEERGRWVEEDESVEECRSWDVSLGVWEEERMSLQCNTVLFPGGWPLCLRGRAVAH